MSWLLSEFHGAIFVLFSFWNVYHHCEYLHSTHSLSKSRVMFTGIIDGLGNIWRHYILQYYLHINWWDWNHNMQQQGGWLLYINALHIITHLCIGIYLEIYQWEWLDKHIKDVQHRLLSRIELFFDLFLETNDTALWLFCGILPITGGIVLSQQTLSITTSFICIQLGCIIIPSLVPR